MNQFRMNRNPGTGRWRRAAVSAASVLLASAMLVVGCGGGGGGGGGGTPGPGTPAGAWYYNGPGTAVRFDLATRDEISVTLNADSQENLGYGGGMFTDVDEQTFTTADPNEYTVNLRNVAPNPFSIRSSLPPASFGISGSVRGPAQPSPNAALFAINTRESANLGDPFFDYVYVFNATLDITFRLRGYRDPVWLGNDRLVVVGEDADEGLFTVTVGGSPTVARIGRAGLGVPGSAPRRPSISPDGRSIVYMHGDSVWRIGVDGSGLTRLSSASATATWPTWSPDGSQIALVQGGVCGGFNSPDIVIISATSANQDLASATRVTRKNGAPVRSCGPVYWLG